MKYQHFSVEEREKIQEMRWLRKSVRSIAQAINRSPSSVARELRRNFPPERQVYTPRLAHERALWKRKSRGRTERLKNEQIRSYVVDHLRRGWSPEQISIRLPHEFTHDRRMRIATESVYQEVYRRVHRGGNGAVKRGAIDLRPYLARRHKRRAKKGFRKAQKAERDASLPSIEQRPSVVERRSRIGDWEDDTLVSRQCRSTRLSLVDR